MKKLAISTNIGGCSTKNNKINDNKELKNEVVQTTPIENKVDYNNSFKGINGCAIFFTPDENIYNIYNKELISEQISPYSTF